MQDVQEFLNVAMLPSQEFVVDLGDYRGIYIWHDRTGGHYCMYLARKDGASLLIDDDDFHDGVTGVLIRDGLTMLGCDTIHMGDINISPSSVPGWCMGPRSDGRPPLIWDPATAEAHLRELVAKDLELRSERAIMSDIVHTSIEACD